MADRYDEMAKRLCAGCDQDSDQYCTCKPVAAALRKAAAEALDEVADWAGRSPVLFDGPAAALMKMHQRYKARAAAIRKGGTK